MYKMLIYMDVNRLVYCLAKTLLKQFLKMKAYCIILSVQIGWTELSLGTL